MVPGWLCIHENGLNVSLCTCEISSFEDHSLMWQLGWRLLLTSKHMLMKCFKPRVNMFWNWYNDFVKHLLNEGDTTFDGSLYEFVTEQHPAEPWQLKIGNSDIYWSWNLVEHTQPIKEAVCCCLFNLTHQDMIVVILLLSC